MAGEKNIIFFKRNHDAIWEGSGPSAVLFHEGQTRDATNKTMAPVSDTGEKTPFENDVNR